MRVFSFIADDDGPEDSELCSALAEFVTSGSAEVRTLERQVLGMTFSATAPAEDVTDGSLPWVRVAILTLPDDTPAAYARDALDDMHGTAGAVATCLTDCVTHFESETARDPDVFMVGVLRRRDGMSREEFDHHWRVIHVPLGMVNASFSKYQTHVIGASLGDLDWDGIVVQEFATKDDLARHAAVRGPHKKQAFEDNPRFMSAFNLYGGGDSR